MPTERTLLRCLARCWKARRSSLIWNPANYYSVNATGSVVWNPVRARAGVEAAASDFGPGAANAFICMMRANHTAEAVDFVRLMASC